ncbi:DNA helicase-2/ATP-dependent DNA helicase PcrA [Desulfohalotomaculum tongense]|uniref:DNA helicase PcrA n=1 Tax=Desulforadius tongensis TaxID=1216062 RepID=UPI00195EC97E|nr:DNA helicase PcrA [Desulforadius tongensis]MBM7854271.1 DNA helicase-2/ATP-dependent DNA helicase PcrA [Desulforadius tongensis]
MQNILENLNPAQQEAVRHTEGPLLVLAGAGSGKTRVLTHRIAYLLQQGILPWNILAITFTNKAAREMQERVANMVPAQQARDLWVSTFHSACLRILRREIENLGYDKNFVIYDTSDQQTVIKECLKELDIDSKRFNPKSLLGSISSAKNRLVGVEEYDAQAFDYYTQTVSRVYKLYQQKLVHNNALDFDDLLVLTVRLFQRFEHLLRYYQDKFQYILVDEYQDTNHVQYVLVNMLASRHRNLCVVGDPNQSIYGWRGADISNILSFERDYPEAKVVKLEQNYRSTQTILDAANAVISRNFSSQEMNLWTALGKGSPIVLKKCEDERMEGFFISSVVRRGVEAGRSYNHFAVLYRTHAQSRAIEESLLAANIPYTIIGGLKFYDRREIKDLLAYLRLVVNPYDTVSFRRVINVPKRGIGPASVEKIITKARDMEASLVDALAHAGEIKGLNSKVRSAAAALAHMFKNFQRQQQYLNVTELVKQVLSESGYWDELEAEDTVESRTRLENLQEFITVTQEYDRNNEAGSLEDFLAGISLVTDQDKYEGESNAVSLMTLHTAKGLEFPVVFLAGMEEGVFPISRSLDEEKEMEEERRLCYVGITRAKEELYLSHCWTRTLFGRRENNMPSRFIGEIPEKLIKEDKPQPVVKQSTSGTGTWGRKSISPGEAEEFQLGDKVMHKKWGPGVIVAIKGEGAEAEITVTFPGQGMKKLIARYAPLQKI